MAHGYGVKPKVLEYLEKRPDTAAIAAEIKQPRKRVSVTLNYLKTCGVTACTENRPQVWSLLT